MQHDVYGTPMQWMHWMNMALGRACMGLESVSSYDEKEKNYSSFLKQR